jgi:hypothetical protein
MEVAAGVYAGGTWTHMSDLLVTSGCLSGGKRDP